MKKLLTIVFATAAVVAGSAGSADAATKKGVCEQKTNINLKLCSSLNFDANEIWATGQGTEIFNTAFGKYTVQQALQRTRCAATDWQTIAESRPVTGNDKLQTITTDIRLVKGYRYRTTIVALTSSPLRVAAVTSPVVTRCG